MAENETPVKVCPIIVTLAAGTAPSDGYRECIGAECVLYDETAQACKLALACDALTGTTNQG